MSKAKTATYQGASMYGEAFHGMGRTCIFDGITNAEIYHARQWCKAEKQITACAGHFLILADCCHVL